MAESKEVKIDLPIVEALKRKGNIFLLVLATVFLADYLTGSPITVTIIESIGRLQGHDPSHRTGFRIITPFGTFTDKVKLAKLQDIFIMVICYGTVLLSYLFHGILTLKLRR